LASIERDVPVQLHVFGLPRAPGMARVREHDSAERAARALKAAGICLGLAALSVFLPIAHFILVPGFLIAAPVFAVRRLGRRASIIALRGTCPRCREERVFEARGAFGPVLHLQTTCPVCSFAIDVETA
jgi:hypothetical protein